MISMDRSEFAHRLKRKVKWASFGIVRGQRIPFATKGARARLLNNYRVSKDILVNDEGQIPLMYFTWKTNFGDLLSPWLVNKMTGRQVKLADKKKPHYVAIGSVVNKGSNQSIYWGTGTYGTEPKEEAPAKAEYTAVRGPLTQAKLGAAMGFGIKVPKIYGDPALLLPFYYHPKVAVTHKYGLVVRWRERKWANADFGPGVKLIDFARDDIEAVIRDLLSCENIVSSSLHGLIVADAYGIPNAWLASNTPRGGAFKFLDYCASVNKLRLPQEFDPTQGEVSIERIRDSLRFDSKSIEFDYESLLDACPFMERVD